MDAQDVGAVVLAAGESRRFGSPKQLALLDGRTLLEHVLERAYAAGLRPVVAVVPIWLTRPAAMTSEGLRWVRNPHPEWGMSHSLRLGFAALPDWVAAAVILLGDQPTVTIEHLNALQAARGDRPFVATRHQGLLVPPVLVERDQFAATEQATGDAGLRDLLRERGDLVAAIDLPAALPDVDTPADLDRMGGW